MKKTIYSLAILAFLVPALTFASFDVSLKYGSKGDAVIELQDFLQNQGDYSGKADGRFGLGTLKAVKAFQTANNLSADGYFGIASRGLAQTLLASDLKASDTAEQTETGKISAPIVTMPGCTSSTGFSMTTGHPCDGSTPAPVSDSGTQNAISALTQQVQSLTSQIQTQTQVQQKIASNTAPIISTPAPVNLNPNGAVIKIQTGYTNPVFGVGQQNNIGAYLYDSSGTRFYTPYPSNSDWGQVIIKDSNGVQVNSLGNPITQIETQEYSGSNIASVSSLKAGTYTITFSIPSMGLSQSVTVTIVDMTKYSIKFDNIPTNSVKVGSQISITTHVFDPNNNEVDPKNVSYGVLQPLPSGIQDSEYPSGNILPLNTSEVGTIPVTVYAHVSPYVYIPLTQTFSFTVTQ